MTVQEHTQEQLSLSDLLKRLIEMGGSDLHLTTNAAPQGLHHHRVQRGHYAGHRAVPRRAAEVARE